MTDTFAQPVSADRKLPPPRPVSWEEFLEWIDEDTPAEWVDGEIILMSPVNLDHQFLSGFVYELLIRFVRARGLGVVLYAPALMRLMTRPSGREPDLVFVATEHLDRLRDTYIDGPADLVVELVSPDSSTRDRREKLAEYEAAAVPEYWIIDPARREALFYQRQEDGGLRAALAADGIYRSMVLPGFWLRVEWLWQRPLPSVPDIVRQLGI